MPVSKEYKSFCLIEEKKQYLVGAESPVNEINKCLNSLQWEGSVWQTQEQQKLSPRATRG